MARREARIILPLHDNEGVPLMAEHRAFGMRVAKAFGGFTAMPIQGGYANDNHPDGVQIEPGAQYTIACPDTPESVEALYAIAKDLLVSCRQKEVYLRLPNGDVEIIGAALAAPVTPQLTQ